MNRRWIALLAVVLLAAWSPPPAGADPVDRTIREIAPEATSDGPGSGGIVLRAAKDDEEEKKEKRSRRSRREKKSDEKDKKDEKGDKKAKPFADAVKDHEKITGLFTIYTKDGEHLLEIRPDQLDKEYMVSVTRERGVGQSFLLAVQVMGENPIRFTKVGKDVQLLLINPYFTSFEDPEMARAVDRSFSDSLVGSSTIKSDPHPETKAVLVDMKPFFVHDVEGVAQFFQQALQRPFAPDPQNSFISDARGFDKNIEIAATMHFKGQVPAPFVNLPDPRSLFVTYRYSVSEVPAAEGFIPRLADDRVGHFITFFMDFGDDTRESPYVRYATRWDLRKKNPNAERSEPIEPITYWLENSIPKKYRKALGDGTLMWNDAFDRIGFKNAVVVKQQPDDAKWDPADVRYTTVRWFVTTTSAFAIGPSRINPHTGQIYDADIGWSEALIAGRLREYEELSNPVSSIEAIFEELSNPTGGQDPRFACRITQGAAMQMGFGLDLLALRGITPDSEKGQAYINGFVKYVQAHEVGHTLGLRHNFRASTINAVRDLQDAEMMRQRGLTSSVMDYVPVNLAGPDDPQGPYWQESLGPYDYWAIEYAYREFPNQKTPQDILPELAEIARRAPDPGQPYGTDEDTTDPRTNVWDLGADPLGFYNDRVGLVKELWAKAPQTFASDAEPWQIMRRAFGRGMSQYALASFNVSKTIGGLLTHRDHVGDPGGRLPMVPVPAARQREALRFLTDNLFAPGAFEVSPDLLNRLGASRWWDLEFSIFDMPRMEYPVHDVVLAIQSNLLNILYGPTRLNRLVDLELMFAPGDEAFTMAEMFSELKGAVWSEVMQGTAPRIDSFRRGLQRAHLDRLIGLANGAASGAPPDAAMMARDNLVDIRKRIGTHLAGTGLDASTRAHLDETAARIDAALSAGMQRAGRREG